MQTENGRLTPIVLTTGCFDVFHHGHVDYLRRIKEVYPNHSLYVGVADDVGVSRLKGTERPIVPAEQRLIMVSACRYVDWARVFDIFEDENDTDQRGMGHFIDMVDPDVFVTGPRSPNQHAHLYLKKRVPFEIVDNVSDFTTTKFLAQIHARKKKWIDIRDGSEVERITLYNYGYLEGSNFRRKNLGGVY